MRYWILLSLAFALLGCADLKKTEQLERIDAIESDIARVESILEEIESLKPDEKIRAYEKKVERLKGLESDTISVDEAKSINKLQTLKANLESLQNYRLVGETETSSTRKRIEQLRSDIEKGSGRRDKYDDYLKDEEAKAGKLKGYFDRSYEKLEAVKKNWESVSNEVDNILNKHVSSQGVQ